MQETSLEIWKSKYQLKDDNGKPIDRTIKDSFKRIAKAIAEVEKPESRSEWEVKFFESLESGCYPAGRIMSNAGAGDYKPSASLINCTVMPEIEDSMDGIMSVLHKAALTLKAGCGTGYCFSSLRPRGAYVSGAGATTSGPIPFMRIYDSMCLTVSSAGGRRGAQMGTFSVEHPDVVEFIKSKREAGMLRNFNLSVLVTDEFMDAVKSDSDWQFRFPASKNDLKIVPDECFEKDGVKYRKYGSIKARELWDLIMKSTYEYAEPGVLFIDRINKKNPLYFCEDIVATNPCGEQSLPDYGSCLLGSIDLTKFVVNPFEKNAYFGFNSFRNNVSVFTRMLDNVVEIANLPLPELDNELKMKRRHGMGFLGLGSALNMLGIKYGSPESIDFVKMVMANMVVEGFKTGVELAKEKGACPILKSQENRDKYVSGDYFTGVMDELVRMSSDPNFYSSDLSAEMCVVIAKIKKHGCRFTHHTSIAPTGTIALSLGNNCSNGIEPTFAHHYSRNVIRQGKKTKESVEVYSAEVLEYASKSACSLDESVKAMEMLKSDTNSLTPEEHVGIQSAAQIFVDSSISKTINVPTDISFEAFKDIYVKGYESGLKGCTTYRYNPEVTQGVLVRKDEAAKTFYVFKTKDGKSFRVRGDENVEYDGHVSTAANLYDALNNNLHGKF